MYFKKKTAAEQAAATEKINGPIYIADPPAHKLRNHYLLRHPATAIVGAIGFVLLLLMLASIPADTARSVEKKPVIKFENINFYSCDDESEPISLNHLFTSSNSNHA